MKQRHWNQKVDLPGKWAPLFASQRRTVMVLLLTAAAIVGILIAMLMWLQAPPHPITLPIWVTEYRSNALPINIVAIRDRMVVRAARGLPPLGMQITASQQRHSLMEQLASLVERSPKDDVLVYVCAYAAPGPHGLCILPADADLDDPQTWLPLRAVLTNLALCPAERKALVLDICWPVTARRQGLISTDIAAAIPAELAAVEDPRRLVLINCSPGQVALSSPVLKQSVFGYYFVRGMEGAADGYNPTGERDGEVSIRELAAFLTARVDRWAIQNQGTRQTPQLVGTGEDFPITAVPVHFARPEVLRAPFAEYPQWLSAAWQWRDELAANQGWRDMPHLMVQLEASLVRVEQLWSAGGDARTLEQQVRNQLQLLFQQQSAISNAIPRTAPRSLALARVLGAPVNPALRQPVETLVSHFRSQTIGLAEAEAQAARNKLLAAFQAQVQDQPFFSVCYAVYEFAAQSPNPDPPLLTLLDDALRQLRGGAPEYVETELLHQLADAARQAPANTWPTATVQLALQAMWLNEQLGCQPWALPWLDWRIRSVHSLVHEGLVYFWSDGYASKQLAAERFNAALDEGRELLAYQTMLQDAYQLTRQAFAQLPTCHPYIEANPQQMATWHNTAQAATTLANLLTTNPLAEQMEVIGLFGNGNQRSKSALALGLRGNTAAVAAWQEQLSQIRQAADQLRTLLADLQQGWNSDRVDQLIEACRRANAGPSVATEAQTLLATPLLPATQRAKLWEAWHQLATRLNGATMLVDRADDTRQRRTMLLEPYDEPEFRATQQALTWYRASSAVDMLQMAGLKGDTIRELESLLAQRKPENFNAISAGLRRAWLVELPAQLSQAERLFEKTRIVRVLSGWAMPPELDNVDTNPVAQFAAQQFRRLWGILGNRYRYIARDLNGIPYYADVASQYLAVAGPVSDRYIQMNVEFPPRERSSSGSMQAVIAWQVVGGSTGAGGSGEPPTEVRFIQPEGDPLVLTLLEPRGPSASTRQVSISQPDPTVEDIVSRPLPNPLVVNVAVSPDASPAAITAAQGFILEVLLDGRRYHTLVPLPNSVLPPVEILLSTNPKAPEPAEDALRLRPLGKPQPYYLYVRSQEPTQQQVNVTINGMATTKVVLAPGQTVPVKFTGEPPKPDTPLPPLTGPIEIECTDATTGELLAHKSIGVAVANPREYMQVNRVDYQANGLGGNRFSIMLSGDGAPLTPPVSAEIEFPPAVNPGLLGVQSGVFRGLLPPNGPLELTAENITFIEGSPEQGEVFLNVDGVPRVYIFDVTYGSASVPAQPVERQRPGVRLVNQPAYQPGPNTSFGIQADVPPSGSYLQFMIGRMEGNRFVPEFQQQLNGPLNASIGCSPFGPGGAILLSASLRDWQLTIDTTGIVGQRTLAGKLIGYDGSTLDMVQANVVFDDAAPKNPQVILPTYPATAGQSYLVKALCTASLSGVTSAEFFFGRPVEGKMPDKTPTVAGTPVDDSNLEWYVELPIPADAKGTLPVSVQLTNAVGLSTVATATIQVQSAQQAGQGTITGKVMEGSLPQAGLTVTLSDDKGTAVKQATSGPDGSFTFPGLQPGKYSVSSYKESSNRGGTAEATVTAGQTTTANISLTLNGGYSRNAANRAGAR